MTDSPRRGRRIHVPTATDDWNRGRPLPPQSPTSREANPPGRLTPAASTQPSEPSASDIESARRVAAARDDLRAKAGELLARVEAAAPLLAALLAEQILAAGDAVVSARRTAAELAAASARDARTVHERERATQAQVIRRAVEVDAPGGWSADIESLGTSPLLPTPGQSVRIGTFSCDGLRGLPVVIPLVDSGGWYVRGPARDAHQLILNTLARIIVQTPLKHLTIHVFDPSVRGSFGVLAPLRTLDGQCFPEPVQQAGVFAERLATVLSSAGHNAEAVVRSGQQSFADFWAAKSIPQGKLNVVVVLDYPRGASDDVSEALQTLAAVHGAAGTCLIVHSEDSLRHDGADAPWLAAMTQVTRQGSQWLCNRLPDGAEFVGDGGLNAATMSAILEQVAASAADVQGPSIGLDELLAGDLEEPWRASSAVSLDAVIGRSDEESLIVSFRTENPPHPNLLIGGAVGTGKSNLLLDIIYSLAVRYSPREVELYLLDFKRGLEFNRFAADGTGQNWLPHMRALSLESSQDFGVAVLQHMDDEMERRSGLFKAAGANSIDSYRRATGLPLPRVLLVVDEFHVLFDGDDASVDAAVRLLAHIAKQGRAYGIHILLSSQTISGIQSLAAKGDSIFAQFPLRMSLKNTAAESQAILSQGNIAASELTYRGEVILNRDFGSNAGGSNIRGLAAYVDPEVFTRVQSQLWQKQHEDQPLVFLSSTPAEWSRAVLADFESRVTSLAHDRENLDLWVGMPIAVSREPVALRLSADIDQTVAVVGPTDALARQAISALAVTAVSQIRGGRLLVLDGAGEASAPWFSAVTAYAADHEVTVDIVARDDIAPYLVSQVAAELEDESRARHTLVLALRLQRARGMDNTAPDEADPDDFTYREPVTGRSVLAQLVQRGELSGFSVVGWWANLRAMEADLGAPLAGVGAFITADVGQEDLRSLVGPHVNRPAGTPRLGIFDRSGDVGLRTVIPFECFAVEES